MDDKWTSQIVTIQLDGKEYTEQVTVAGLERWLATYEHKEHFLYKKNQALYDKLTQKKEVKKQEDKDSGDHSETVSKPKKGT